ncbi:MAG: hypothetical protein V1707_01575 [bacterium]
MAKKESIVALEKKTDGKEGELITKEQVIKRMDEVRKKSLEELNQAIGKLEDFSYVKDEQKKIAIKTGMKHAFGAAEEEWNKINKDVVDYSLDVGDGGVKTVGLSLTNFNQYKKKGEETPREKRNKVEAKLERLEREYEASQGGRKDLLRDLEEKMSVLQTERSKLQAEEERLKELAQQSYERLLEEHEEKKEQKRKEEKQEEEHEKQYEWQQFLDKVGTEPKKERKKTKAEQLQQENAGKLVAVKLGMSVWDMAAKVSGWKLVENAATAGLYSVLGKGDKPWMEKMRTWLQTTEGGQLARSYEQRGAVKEKMEELSGVLRQETPKEGTEKFKQTLGKYRELTEEIRNNVNLTPQQRKEMRREVARLLRGPEVQAMKDRQRQESYHKRLEEIEAMGVYNDDKKKLLVEAEYMYGKRELALSREAYEDFQKLSPEEKVKKQGSLDKILGNNELRYAEVTKDVKKQVNEATERYVKIKGQWAANARYALNGALTWSGFLAARGLVGLGAGAVERIMKQTDKEGLKEKLYGAYLEPIAKALKTIKEGKTKTGKSLGVVQAGMGVFSLGAQGLSLLAPTMAAIGGHGGSFIERLTTPVKIHIDDLHPALREQFGKGLVRDEINPLNVYMNNVDRISRIGMVKTGAREIHQWIDSLFSQAGPSQATGAEAIKPLDTSLNMNVGGVSKEEILAQRTAVSDRPIEYGKVADKDKATALGILLEQKKTESPADEVKTDIQTESASEEDTVERLKVGIMEKDTGAKLRGIHEMATKTNIVEGTTSKTEEMPPAPSNAVENNTNTASILGKVPTDNEVINLKRIHETSHLDMETGVRVEEHLPNVSKSTTETPIVTSKQESVATVLTTPTVEGVGKEQQAAYNVLSGNEALRAAVRSNVGGSIVPDHLTSAEQLPEDKTKEIESAIAGWQKQPVQMKEGVIYALTGKDFIKYDPKSGADRLPEGYEIKVAPGSQEVEIKHGDLSRTVQIWRDEDGVGFYQGKSLERIAPREISKLFEAPGSHNDIATDQPVTEKSMVATEELPAPGQKEKETLVGLSDKPEIAGHIPEAVLHQEFKNNEIAKQDLKSWLHYLKTGELVDPNKYRPVVFDEVTGDVREEEIYQVYKQLKANGLDMTNLSQLTDLGVALKLLDSENRQPGTVSDTPEYKRAMEYLGQINKVFPGLKVRNENFFSKLAMGMTEKLFKQEEANQTTEINTVPVEHTMMEEIERPASSQKVEMIKPETKLREMPIEQEKLQPMEPIARLETPTITTENEDLNKKQDDVPLMRGMKRDTGVKKETFDQLAAQPEEKVETPEEVATGTKTVNINGQRVEVELGNKVSDAEKATDQFVSMIKEKTTTHDQYIEALAGRKGGELTFNEEQAAEEAWYAYRTKGVVRAGGYNALRQTIKNWNGSAEQTPEQPEAKVKEQADDVKPEISTEKQNIDTSISPEKQYTVLFDKAENLARDNVDFLFQGKPTKEEFFSRLGELQDGPITEQDHRRFDLVYNTWLEDKGNKVTQRVNNIKWLRRVFLESMWDKQSPAVRAKIGSFIIDAVNADQPEQTKIEGTGVSQVEETLPPKAVAPEQTQSEGKEQKIDISENNKMNEQEQIGRSYRESELRKDYIDDPTNIERNVKTMNNVDLQLGKGFSDLAKNIGMEIDGKTGVLRCQGVDLFTPAKGETMQVATKGYDVQVITKDDNGLVAKYIFRPLVNKDYQLQRYVLKEMAIDTQRQPYFDGHPIIVRPDGDRWRIDFPNGGMSVDAIKDVFRELGEDGVYENPQLAERAQHAIKALGKTVFVKP